MFEQYLINIGLSEKEAKVYLKLLQVDRDNVTGLAKKTKINRTTIYPVIESLKEKGLVSEVNEGKKVEFQAEPLERLETYVERQKVLYEESAKRLRDVIPQIKSIEREAGERPVVKYFEGRDGAISAYEEFYSFDPEIEETGYFIYNKDLLARTFTPEEQKRFLDTRIGKMLKPVSVYNYTEGDFTFKTPGWGGSPTIIGSPQGVSSKVTPDQLSEIIGRHLS